MDLAQRLETIQSELLDEYRQPGRRPWVVGFSGGKDSTLLLHLVFGMLLELPPSARRRQVYVVSNDTLVESPIVAAFVAGVLAKVADAAESLLVPVRVVTTTPERGQSFWCNMIGRGYPSPSRSFRWCTDRLKIRPTGRFIRELADATGAVLLIGTRRDESAQRAKSIAKHEGTERLNPHGTVKGVDVFAPIKELSTEDVWTVLLQQRAHWGGTFRQLVTLYRNAQGGECPFVVDADDAPSCGESPSSRFGCWTCTVVAKDRSLQGFVDNGAEHLAPLIEFRDWVKELSGQREARMDEGRDGREVEFAGPFTIESRKLVLARLLETQAEVGVPLISAEEIAWCKAQWAQDACDLVVRRARVMLQILGQ